LKRLGRARTPGLAALVCTVALGMGPAPAASAHTRSLSYSAWEIVPGGARVQVRVSQLDLSRLGIAFAGTTGGTGAIGDTLRR